MLNWTKHFPALLVSLAVLFQGGTAIADITSVSPSPARSNVPVSGPASLNIVWNVTRLAAPVTATLASTQGTFLAGATVVGTSQRTLSRSVTGAVTVSLSESLLVPRTVILRARRLGFASITYSRTFQDGGQTFATNAVVLAVTGSSAGGFSISRVALRFDDDAPVRVLSIGEPLRAYAEINFTGTGLFKAVWELADPTGTTGGLVFRPLRIVRQYLTAGRRATLWSPDLPTRVSGVHLLRLRITEPAPAFDDPIIRYFVTPDFVEEAPQPVVTMRLTSPRQMGSLAPNTRFAWELVAGAHAYQLELFTAPPVGAVEPPDTDLYGTPVAEPEEPVGETVAGVLVPGDVTATTLAAISREHLQSGRRYRWRVRAIGEQGTFIGASPVRELYVP